ncbi:PREDICTED: uncharacterized protein LOC109581487 [Amphimedon queenslandica]|uniref:Uncharacterized protein n=1 Tax=Amphimedon queenslandica TaxID=400682 RepID=A0A1X7V113_AMPQE|nr:PREDICTED: uncharacterized protein LOC109581487 [Amphimedon queenslandica]|eukprot:XP_019851179.1 PREDICTED: uncharacterized protein LOC109581487 [Amphimedon queenslandica]
MDRFKSGLCELGPGLSNHQFHCIKIACYVFLGISRQTLETVTTFIALYDLMKQALPHGADLLIYQILLKLNVSKSKLAKIDPHINRKHEKDFILDNPQLDLFLTVAVMLDKLSNERYQKFRNQCVQSFLVNYHVDNITSRAVLLELLADRGLLDPNDLTSLFLLFHHITSTDGSTQYIKVLREFCTRQGIDEPDWTQSQLPNNMSESLICQLQVEIQLSRSSSYGSSLRGTVSSNVINGSNVPVHYKNKGCGFNFNIRRIIIHSVFIALFFLICLCLLIGFGLFFTGTYFHQLTNIQANSSHQIGANSIVQLFPGQCINPDWIKSISITVQSSLNITVYKGLCTDQPSTEVYNLESKTYHRTQSFYKYLKNYCFNANYYGEKQSEHYPLYTAGHGTLSYDIQLVNASEIDESPCPLILYLFNESYYYNYWVKTNYYGDQQSIAEVAYAYSPCLNTSDAMNRDQNYFFNFKHDFELEDKGFYYTLCCITVSFFSNLTISGRVTKYSEKKMEELQSCLSPNAVQGDANCTVNMGNFFDSSFNLFVDTTYELSERNATVVVTPEEWNIASVLCLLLTVLVIISSIIVIIVVISCKQKKRIKDYSTL